MVETPSPSDAPKETAQRLLDAAIEEFNAHGFAGTDTNRIARRAGFAPQTFYRWYEDKIDVFIRAYQAWQTEEAHTLGNLLRENAPDAEIAQAAVAHHRAFLNFRRSLKLLSLENPKVRAARAESRRRQIQMIRMVQGERAQPETEIVALLFQMERLADALGEGEIADMGLDPASTEAALAGIIGRLRRGA
ncbi:MAG: TetR/AcrR family transcriptional regulator [Phenylobacterium sp.]